MEPADPLDAITRGYLPVVRGYDRGQNDLAGIGNVAVAAVELLLGGGTTVTEHGRIATAVGNKVYEVRRRGQLLSRPIRRDLFIADPAELRELWREVIAAVDTGRRTLVHPRSDAAFYTAAVAFAAAYDLYRPSSRKTPGTFFEVIVGTLLGAVSGLPRYKQISLPDSQYRVTTDIVLRAEPPRPSLVLPTKITTRERVVQPWAHQRILDDAFGVDHFRSVLVVVSELQRQREERVNEICIPGQIGLFQRHLARLSGMYYLDPPGAYVTADFARDLPTRPLSALLERDLTGLLDG